MAAFENSHQDLPESAEDELLRELLQNIRGTGFTSQELQAAYAWATGISENDTSTAGSHRPEVRMLAEKMKQVLDRGLPAPKILELINKTIYPVK